MIDLKDKNIKFFIKIFSNSIRWDTSKYFDEFDLYNSNDIRIALFKKSLINDKNLALELFETFSSREVDVMLKENHLYEKVKKYTLNQLVKSIKENEGE